MWCFLSNGRVELALSVEGSAMVLYVMDTDEEVRFSGREALEAWLLEHWPDAMRPNPPRGGKRERTRKFFEWG